MTNLIEPQLYPYFLVFFALLMPLLLSYRMFPVIIYLVITKNLMDDPVDRSTHKQKTPTLGGLGIFIAFSLPIIILGLGSNFSQLDLVKLLSVISGGILLLFAGIKDDLVGLAPKKKIMVQAVAALIVIFFTDVRIHSFYGIFGIEEIPYFISVALTLLAFVSIINAVNLIDGVDGLAGSFGIIASLAFGVFFVINKYYLMALVSFVIIGALLGFLRFNFSKTRKIFMGDSGSMFLGFLLAFQAICFLTCNTHLGTSFKFTNGPILFLAVLSFPLIDTIRVFCIRIKQKRSPFSADRNHIHHRLTNLGCSHKQTSALIGLATLFVIGCALLMVNLHLALQLVMILAVITTVFLSPWLLVGKPKPAAIGIQKAASAPAPAEQKLAITHSKREEEMSKAAALAKNELNGHDIEELRDIQVDIVEVKHGQMEKTFAQRMVALSRYQKSE